MLKLDKKTILLLLLLGGVFGGIAYAIYASGLFDLFINRRHLNNFIKEHRTYAALIFIGLQALQVVAAPVPGEVTGFFGGSFFKAWGIAYSMIGLTIGSWIAFMLARMLGRPLVVRMVSADTIQRYDYVMKHKGLWLAFLMFLVPGFPKDFLCYLLGLGHMRQRDFLLISASGRLFGTVLLTMGGTYFHDERYGALFTIVGISIIVILFFMIYHDRIEQMLKRMAGGMHKDDKDHPPE
jgi:uncharacterized membrane protein YdjX (TVP38/TMEM64 family)